ncbi:MAG TPA: enoyl-CoA hydratase-related protein [Thermoleophilia bacterium]|nr:enoyl-CoA hydratase-related protein [Thermoleophilia bacterium]
MPAEYATILYEKSAHVAWITLNRPEVLNAQSDELRAEVVQALEQASFDDEVHVVVITGAGDKAFSAGADISQFPTRYPIDVVTAKARRRPYEMIREMPKPVIAAVNGLALGGGCELVLACDIVIAADSAKFGQPEIRVGLIPGCGGSQVLPRLMGEKKAKELIFTGRMMTAEEAERYGIVNQVVPLAELREATEGFVADLLRNSPAILRIAKLAVNKSLETPLSVGMSYERDLFALCFGTDDQKEGAKAFLEKRKPTYEGR